MEIIRRGKFPADIPHEAKCIHCGTLVRFLQREAKYNFDQRDGDYLSVPCPVCPATITKSTDHLVW